MKKAISMILSALLFISLMVPAAADETKPVTAANSVASKDSVPEDSKKAEERLAEITLKVKDILGVSNDYTNFYGNHTDSEYGTRWQLNWSGANDSLNVQTDDNGKIYSMNLNTYNYNDEYYYKYYYRQNYNPVFPKVTKAEAVVAAKAFLAKVLDKNESVELGKYEESPQETATYSFSGNLTVNGLKTDSWVNINVRTSDLTVTYFYRDDAYYYISGGFPTPDTAVTPEEALALFKSTYTAKAQYAIVDGSKTAKLVYYMSQNGSYVVDAKTGKLVSFNDYYAYDKGYGMNSYDTTAEAGTRDVYLTDTELKGIKYYEGTLTAEQLDAIVRAEPAFGLTKDYVMGGVSYNVVSPDGGVTPIPLEKSYVSPAKDAKTDTVTGDISATFTYTLKITDYAAFGISDQQWEELTKNGSTPQVNKTFTLDAKTGEIDNCYTNYYGFNWIQGKTTDPVISKTAENYIAERYPEWFKESGLYSSYANNWNVETYSFTYCQKVNGWFYPGNSIYVTTNAKTGYIDNFSCYWDDTVTFEPAASVISEETAVKAYMGAFKANLQYSRLPIKSDPVDYNYSAAYQVLLAYNLITKDNTRYVQYIDAVTGEVKYYEGGYENLTLAYDDIDKSYAKDEILKLAGYGVGYYSPSFEPEKKLTELDMVLFLISANGYKYKYGDFEDYTLTAIYDAAYSLNILEKGQKEPDRAITRTDIVRSFVSMAGHSDVAKLKGIYRCGFTDDADIAAEDYGYVAIAKGLGIITGDPSGSFRPNDAITRQELAHMMFKYMSR